MKLPFIVRWDWLLRLMSKLNGFPVAGVEYIPFVIVVHDLNDKVIINHELIHYRQMLETLFVGYYLVYVVHYLWLRMTYGHRVAYWNICLEREAYENAQNLDYLRTRKLFAWLRK